MPINADYEYFEAEKKYLQAVKLEDKIIALEEMIRKAPKHKGTENLLAELKTRLKKFKEKSEKSKKVGGGKKGLKKEGYQVALMGNTNSGKSALLSALTNAQPAIGPNPFTTRDLEVGTMDYEGVRAQIVDLPSVGSSSFDIGLVNTADCIVLVIDSLDSSFFETLNKFDKMLGSARGTRIIVFNKIDLLDSNTIRVLRERCKAKRIDAIFVSSVSKEGILELKRALFDKMNVIRIYMKEPGKEASKIPMILKENSRVVDVAESIRHGFAKTVKETRITGPSGKFANQKVGLGHVLKDKDVVEFHTK